MLSKQEIADAIVSLTDEYTETYFQTFKRDMDRQLWAALHVGFIAAMELNGYDKETLDEALAIALDIITD